MLFYCSIYWNRGKRYWRDYNCMIINHVDYNNHIKIHFWGIRIQEVAFLGKDTKNKNQRKTSDPQAKHTQPEAGLYAMRLWTHPF